MLKDGNHTAELIELRSRFLFETASESRRCDPDTMIDQTKVLQMTCEQETFGRAFGLSIIVPENDHGDIAIEEGVLQDHHLDDPGAPADLDGLAGDLGHGLRQGVRRRPHTYHLDPLHSEQSLLGLQYGSIFRATL
jgi:hypothetical protein